MCHTIWPPNHGGWSTAWSRSGVQDQINICEGQNNYATCNLPHLQKGYINAVWHCCHASCATKNMDVMHGHRCVGLGSSTSNKCADSLGMHWCKAQTGRLIHSSRCRVATSVPSETGLQICCHRRRSRISRCHCSPDLKCNIQLDRKIARRAQRDRSPVYSWIVNSALKPSVQVEHSLVHLNFSSLMHLNFTCLWT